MSVEPRVIRMKDAPAYLGMSRAVFRRSVLPFVPSFPVGDQGVGFDRRDLDDWLDRYKAAHAIDKTLIHAKSVNCSERSISEDSLWGEKICPASPREASCGTSTRLSAASDFTRALVAVRERKPKGF